MPKFDTRARVALSVRTRALTQDQIAARLKCSQPMASDYLAGESRPVAWRRALALKAWRIPLLWWLTPEEGGPSIPSHAANPEPAPVGAQADRPGSTARKRIRGAVGCGQGSTRSVAEVGA